MKTNNFIALRVAFAEDEVFPIIKETEKAMLLKTAFGEKWMPKSAVGVELDHCNIATIPDSEDAYFISPFRIKAWFADKFHWASGKTWHWVTC